MSFRNLFSIRKTKPRKFTSRSPFKLPSEELAREFGPQYQTIDVRIGNQKVIYNITQGYWTSDGIIDTSASSRDINKLEKTKLELEEDNNTLQTKLDTLVDMLAEINAEYELRRIG